MAKVVGIAILDAALNAIKNGSNRLVVCSAQPTSYAEVTSFRLAEVAVVPADLVLGAGDVSGRKVTAAAKAGVAISANGTATHVCLANSTNSTVDVVTTCTSQALSTGGTVDIPSWKYEINQPT